MLILQHTKSIRATCSTYSTSFQRKQHAQLAELALADEANIVADKIFNGLVEGRVSKQL